MPRRGPASSVAAVIGQRLPTAGVPKPRLDPSAVRRSVGPRPAPSPRRRCLHRPPHLASPVPAEARAASASSGDHVPTQAHGPRLPQPLRLQLQRWVAAVGFGDRAFPTRPDPEPDPAAAARRRSARFPCGEGEGAGMPFGAHRKLVAGCQGRGTVQKKRYYSPAGQRESGGEGPGPHTAVRDAQVEAGWQRLVSRSISGSVLVLYLAFAPRLAGWRLELKWVFETSVL